MADNYLIKLQRIAPNRMQQKGPADNRNIAIQILSVTDATLAPFSSLCLFNVILLTPSLYQGKSNKLSVHLSSQIKKRRRHEEKKCGELKRSQGK